MKHEKWEEQGEGGNLDVVVTNASASHPALQSSSSFISFRGAPLMNIFVHKIMQAYIYSGCGQREKNSSARTSSFIKASASHPALQSSSSFISFRGAPLMNIFVHKIMQA